MKDKMERLVSLPFSIGCVSQSSIAVVENQPKKAHTEPPPPPPAAAAATTIRSESQSSGKAKSSMGLLAIPRPSIYAGIQRLIRGFKSLSQLFVVYKDEDEDVEMEIGFPTDVQHVAHIGWDGFNNVGTMNSWDRAAEFLPIPSLSLSQFELAMAAQANAPLAQGGGSGGPISA